MVDYEAFFAALIQGYRLHKIVAITLSVSGRFFVNVQRVKAIAAVVSATTFHGIVFLSAIFTDKAFVYDDEFFHNFSSFYYY